MILPSLRARFIAHVDYSARPVKQHVLVFWDMGLEIFRDEVMNNESVRKRSVDGLLKMIEQEREGGQVSLCHLI
ncbi:unnamed protein product [Wuchereria bancrofti]|uniref:Cullin N-terminal domain-containing protein n=1 Tax=Wuchereria bancrofti TaxID=6293 RepID=A0A3P7EG47_WUCBA|nr:unnamed protein product [Wuchereria bancrofti]